MRRPSSPHPGPRARIAHDGGLLLVAAACALAALLATGLRVLLD
ncbi:MULTISPECIES: hypothetical protein [Nocardioides]|uniref:Uncharacterized protein n=1 Tax=Nocardioides kribbensis TaxID=305517 RepID=A0ABV1P1J3_9ACTN|nr:MULTISPECIES: hypothetical protein [Nocardioides]